LPTNKLDEKMVLLLNDMPQVAEVQYYGFGWTHFMEKSPDYDGDKTFFQFDDEELLSSYVEVHIIEPPKECKSKTGNTYYTVMIQDATWTTAKMTVWGEDYARFKEEFEWWENDQRKGNLLKIMVRRPQAGFNSYTFESPSKRDRWRLIPKNKEDDMRVVKMSRP
jgi:hypothetical protein